MRFEVIVRDVSNEVVAVFNFVGNKVHEGSLEKPLSQKVKGGYALMTGFRLVPAVEHRFDDQDSAVAKAAREGFEGK